MVQTENTAIVLRNVNYRDNDRMVTLLSPSRGRIDAIIRNCRKPRSHNLNAGELFALGDYMIYEASGRATVTSVQLIETFYPLRNDYDRFTCGVYLLNLAEAAAEPEQESRELFMLLLHTLSRLTFSDQEWKPLISGFLIHLANCEGFKPRLNHCVFCGEKLETGPYFFSLREGGVCCAKCRNAGTYAGKRKTEENRAVSGADFRDMDRDCQPISQAQLSWMRQALRSGSASWVNTLEAHAPFSLLRSYVEERLGRRIRSGALLPGD